jgi:multiple sugar transport system substrate-binding protein
MFGKSKWVASGLTALTLLVAGCAPSTSGESTSKPGAVSGESDKPVTIKFMHWYNTKDSRYDVVIQEFEKKNPNIKVESILLDPKGAAESMQKLDLMAASGEDMDVVMFPDSTAYAQRAGMGLVDPLEPYLEKEKIKYEDEYSYDSRVLGKLYALPGKISPDFVTLNKDELDKANLPVPKDWTWDEMLDYAKKLTYGEGEKKHYGVYFHSDQTTLVLDMLPKDNLLVKDDGTSNITNPAVRKSLEVLQQSQQVDKSATPYIDIISQKLYNIDSYFKGKVTEQVMCGCMIQRMGGFFRYSASFKTVFAPYPKLTKADPVNTHVSSDYISIASSSKHKDAAYKFIRYFSTEGINNQGFYFSAWKKMGTDAMVDNIISHTEKPEFVDKESIKYVMSVTEKGNFSIPPTYYGEVKKAYNEEAELFLVGKQDLDTAISKADAKVKKIIETYNKK